LKLDNVVVTCKSHMQRLSKMECQEIKKLLNPYLDGILDKETSSLVKEHITHCSDCRKAYLELKEIISGLNLLAEQSQRIPDSLQQNIMNKIMQQEVQIETNWMDKLKKGLSFPRISFRIAGTAVAATAAMFFLAFTFIFNAPTTSPLCSAEVQFSLALGDRENHVVAIAGDFNDWNHESNLLDDSDKDGVWTGTLTLEPGRYKYMFVLDGKEWVPDPNALRYVKDGFGNRNSILEINSCSG